MNRPFLEVHCQKLPPQRIAAVSAQAIRALDKCGANERAVARLIINIW